MLSFRGPLLTPSKPCQPSVRLDWAPRPELRTPVLVQSWPHPPAPQVLVTVSDLVAQACLEVTEIPLPQLPKCWNECATTPGSCEAVLGSLLSLAQVSQGSETDLHCLGYVVEPGRPRGNYRGERVLNGASVLRVQWQ